MPTHPLLQEYQKIPLVQYMMEHDEFKERLSWIKQAKKLSVSGQNMAGRHL
jgi:hypothetical protein